MFGWLAALPNRRCKRGPADSEAGTLMTTKRSPADDRSMQLASALAWLVDVAAETPVPELFLAGLGQRLVADGAPLAAGALTLVAPHPLIARRTWLWRAESGEVSEALGFQAGGLAHSRPQSPRTTPAAAGSKGSLPDPCMRTRSRQSQAGQASAGSGCAPSPPGKPAGSARPRASPQRRSPR